MNKTGPQVHAILEEKRSDRDFLEPSLKTYVGLAEDLERLFGRKVDLVSARAIRNPSSQNPSEKLESSFYEAA